MDSSIPADTPLPVASRELAAFAQAWNQTLVGDDVDRGPASASVLRLLSLTAALTEARAAVQVGCFGGQPGLALFAGMPDDAVLTIVEPDPERLRQAREAFSAAEIAPSRTRLIAAAPKEVLARLTDAGYDLFICTGSPSDHHAMAHEAARLLRPGGLAVFLDVADAADPARREQHQLAVRSFAEHLQTDEHWLPGLLPVDDGVMLAVLR